MATPGTTTSRRTILGALLTAPALAALPAVASAAPVADRGDWDRRLHEYRRLKVRERAETMFGPYRKAMNAYSREVFEHEQRHGAKWTEQSDAIWDRMRAAEATLARDFFEPAEIAGLALIQAAAPDLDAVTIKIEVIDELGLVNHDEPPFDPMAIIDADLTRLAAGRA